jgi:hypothetical protein
MQRVAAENKRPMEARAAIKVDEKWRWEILIRLIEREQSSKIGQDFWNFLLAPDSAIEQRVLNSFYH